MTAEPAYDVAVIGAGVVGAAIARELSCYQLRTILVEAAGDVGTGTSKANTAIRHTGFDAKPATLESELLRRGFPLLTSYAAAAGIPLEVTGALLVAWDAEQLATLSDLAERSKANGYTAIRHVTPDELHRREPHLGPGARGAFAIPDEGIICPFTTSLAFATEAVSNGVRLRLSSPVTGVQLLDGTHVLRVPGGEVTARWTVNAAGLHSDTVDHMFGHQRFTIRPRRGELIVFDKLARPLVNSVLLPVPSSAGKGVLVAPTVFGNVLLGPTAEDISDRSATQSTQSGVAGLLAKGSRIVPELLDEEVTSVYVGLRAATEHADYQLACYPDQRYICVGGIRSTGLSASMGIAAYVADLLADSGLGLHRTAHHRQAHMPPIGEATLRPYQDEDAISADPAYGQVVCFCERVTRGEILAAAAAPLPARTIDGLRRRTRAMLGRCQGFYCGAHITALLAEAAGTPAEQLLHLGGTAPAPAPRSLNPIPDRAAR
ncbi:MAG TPA: NAD(P)/FAD-dependent oxidoreductase [Streptosporangiaceae bacterium]|nr:NAD(P)/FAD-dependent oxidoreductase [Streptosporangiaceae bacterium]